MNSVTSRIALFFAAGLLVTDASSAGAQEEGAPLEAVPSRLRAPPIARAKSLSEQEDLLRHLIPLPGGRTGVKQGSSIRLTTLDRDLQTQLVQTLVNYQTPYSAVVALEPATGRVLAMAEHSEFDPTLRGLPTKAVFPAASVFKLVTASALLKEGVTPEDVRCFHGGKRKLNERLLSESSRDSQCLTLSTALAKSANVIFAKWTMEKLTPDLLAAMALKYRFNRPLAFPILPEISQAAFPADRFDFASTGAGFGDVYLSPLHAAALVSVAANEGIWKDPVLFEEARSSGPFERIIPAEDAHRLADMMEETVTHGTARRIFQQPGHRIEGAVGKTGSLADRKPFRDYSWFVGYAPKNHPQIAVAAVIVNGAKWRVRAPFLAREAMRIYLDRKNRRVASR